METLPEFYSSLKPGDIITTVGVQPAGKEELLVGNCYSHKKWGRYARVTEVAKVGSPMLKSGTVGIKIEGIDPSLSECMWRSVDAKDTHKANIRKANDMEHHTFMEEYLKVRVALNEHRQEEAKATFKQLKKERARLNKIAKEEDIPINKLV